MFRIYRDTRFAKDKSPYKTHVAAHFRHKQTSADVHGPGFYFHLDPGGCFIGGGLWLPEPPSLKKVRDSIAYDPKGWGKVRRAVKEIEGDGLTRPPQGYDPRPSLHRRPQAQELLRLRLLHRRRGDRRRLPRQRRRSLPLHPSPDEIPDRGRRAGLVGNWSTPWL